MSKKYEPIADTRVINRIAVTSHGGPMSELTVPMTNAVLYMMRSVGIVPAMSTGDDPVEQALAELLAAYRDGTHQHIREMRVAWPPLLAALEKLAELHPPIGDPLYDMLKDSAGDHS